MVWHIFWQSFNFDFMHDFYQNTKTTFYSIRNTSKFKRDANLSSFIYINSQKINMKRNISYWIKLNFMNKYINRTIFRLKHKCSGLSRFFPNLSKILI